MIALATVEGVAVGFSCLESDQLVWARFTGEQGRLGDYIARTTEGLAVFVSPGAWSELRPVKGDVALITLTNNRVGRAVPIGYMISSQAEALLNCAYWAQAETVDEAKAKLAALAVAEYTAVRAKEAGIEAERAKGRALEEEFVSHLPADALPVYQAMRKHDWYYAFSDDSRVFRDGEKSWSELNAQLLALRMTKPGMAQLLWEHSAPRDFRCPW